MEEYAKEILNFLNNKHTKIKEKEEFKGNYYSYITDTIYVSKNYKDTALNKKEKIDDFIGTMIMLCHEAWHSVQNKGLHICNTVLSNLSIVFTLALAITRIFIGFVSWLSVLTVLCVTISICVRVFMENDAISNSTKLLKEFLRKGSISNKYDEAEIIKAEKYIKKHKIFAMLLMIKDKLIMLVVAVIVIII